MEVLAGREVVRVVQFSVMLVKYNDIRIVKEGSLIGAPKKMPKNSRST